MMYKGRYELYGWTGQGMRAYMYMCEGLVLVDTIPLICGVRMEAETNANGGGM